jgi:hypothetical protein
MQKQISQSNGLQQQLADLHAALIDSLQLQSEYAELLNIYDGGQRPTYSSVATWIDHLYASGRLPVGKDSCPTR